MVKRLHINEASENTKDKTGALDLKPIKKTVNDISKLNQDISSFVEQMTKWTSNSYISTKEYKGMKENIGICTRYADKLLANLQELDKYFKD